MSEYSHVMEELEVDHHTAERIVEVAEEFYDGDFHLAEFAMRMANDNGIDVEHYVDVEGHAANLGCDTADLLGVLRWAKVREIFDS